MSKKDKARELESLLDSKREHTRKRSEAEEDGNLDLVKWYDKEIAEMNRHIGKLESELNTSEEECPNCERIVVPVSNRCPKCGAYMG